MNKRRRYIGHRRRKAAFHASRAGLRWRWARARRAWDANVHEMTWDQHEAARRARMGAGLPEWETA